MRVIEGVRVRDLKVITDERGRLMEMLRSDSDIFIKFGQMYMTTAYPGVVKAWHYHKKQTDYFVCVKGMMKVVLYDDRHESPTFGELNEFFIGEHSPRVIVIPPLVYHGFKCISDTEAMVINCPTEVYNYDQPDEYRISPHRGVTESGDLIPYDWKRSDG